MWHTPHGVDEQVFTFMREGGFINSQTTEIHTKFMTFNADEQTFSVVQVSFVDNGGGSMDATTDISVLTALNWKLVRFPHT